MGDIYFLDSVDCVVAGTLRVPSANDADLRSRLTAHANRRAIVVFRAYRYIESIVRRRRSKSRPTCAGNTSRPHYPLPTTRHTNRLPFLVTLTQ